MFSLEMRMLRLRSNESPSGAFIIIQRTAGMETSGGFLCLEDEVQNAPGEVRFSWAPFGAGHFMRPDGIALQAETDRL